MPPSSQTGVQEFRISPEDLKARLESGGPATVIDVRGHKAWETSDTKIRGAVRANPENFQADRSWPKDRLTVVY